MDSDETLNNYFTNVEELKQLFEHLVSTSNPKKPLLIIHGVGGVGKSSLLRIFRLHCKSSTIPVSYTSGDEVHSTAELLESWVKDFELNGIKLPNTRKMIKKYYSIYSRVNRELTKNRKIAGKVAVKTAESAAGTALGAAFGSIIPGAGTFAGSALGAIIGASGEELMDWWRSFLKKSEISLFQDPSHILEEKFLSDLDRLSSKKPIALLLDTYEQFHAIDKWIREFAKRLHPNILFVIAGRKIPRWDRYWPGWGGRANIEELKPMDDATMGELINKYYNILRGGTPNSKQVNAIIKFARGLPIVVTTAVNLWVEYGIEDFQEVKPQVVAGLVDRLLEGVSGETVSAIEAAAAVRWFNKEILKAVSRLEDCDNIYNELRRFPFTRPRREGFTLHDAIRDIITENLLFEENEKYLVLHQRALEYFEKLLINNPEEDPERIELERLYHLFCLDEKKGMHTFKKIGEQLSLYRFINRLQGLLKDVRTYSLNLDSSQRWWDYYNARLSHLESRLQDAEKAYEKIINDENSSDHKLKAYALCDWGEILARYERLGKSNGVRRAKKVLEESLVIGKLDSHLVKSYFSLARVARYDGLWDKEKEYLDHALTFFKNKRDLYGRVQVYAEMKQANARRGIWNKFFQYHELSAKLLEKTKLESSYLKATVLKMWLWAWALAGRILECEKKAREALEITRELQDDITTIRLLRDLGWSLGIQNRFDEAMPLFKESLEIAERLGPIQISEKAYTLGFWGAMLTRLGEIDQAKKYLLESLQIKKNHDVKPGILESLVWLGMVSEVDKNWSCALDYYQEGLKWKWFGDNYFYCGCLTGLIRVNTALKRYDDLSRLFKEAEELALIYEYNDYLASLKLSKGHLNWSSNISFERDTRLQSVLEDYQQAIMFALNYNRFMLDEILWSGGVKTPFQPIIQSCLAREGEGKEILNKLSNWWKEGEGTSLIEAEQLARKREPGDSSPQKSVLEHLEEAISNLNSSAL